MCSFSASASLFQQYLIPEVGSRLSIDACAPVILGGYSLAALFALWAGYTSDRFDAVAAASPSVWFPGWLDFIGERTPAAESIYLSLGLKEEKTRNRVMATVGDNIRRQYELLLSQDISCTTGTPYSFATRSAIRVTGQASASM